MFNLEIDCPSYASQKDWDMNLTKTKFKRKLVLSVQIVPRDSENRGCIRRNVLSHGDDTFRNLGRGKLPTFFRKSVYGAMAP